MCGKWWIAFPLASLLSLVACRHEMKVESSVEYDVDSLLRDTLQADTLSLEEEEINEAEETEPFDENFDDFLYVFLHSRKLQSQRVGQPLWYVDGVGDTTQMNIHRDWKDEFGFLGGDFFTVLYGSEEQMDDVREQNADSVVVDRIDLGARLLTSYAFSRSQGRWMLRMVESSSFQQSVVSDFLHFYAAFSADTLYQQESISQPLKLCVPSPDEDDEYLRGTIDASQWSSFSIDVPGGIISNIRYGQTYDTGRIVMQKCGISNGMQEIYIFARQAGRWKLTSYEN